MPKPIKLSKADIKKFWTLVEKRGPNDCWRWLGVHNHKIGYAIYTLHLGIHLSKQQLTYRQIAERLGYTRKLVPSVCRGENWSWLTGISKK
jgi:hypothetical protein